MNKIFENLKQVNESLNAVVSFVEPQDAKEGRISNWDIALKDNFNMIDTLTTASCRILANHISIYNATATQKILDQGGVVLAKTSMDELGMGGTNLSAATGPVKNPYDTSRISGGSSGGSAALVGAKAIRVAMGSDTGDSVRKPAAYCGVVGVKPTYGRISRYGVIPYASSLDHVGYFTQNVEDAAIMLEVLAGRDDLDMTSSHEPVEAYASLLDMDLEGKRIGVFQSIHDVIEDQAFLDQFNTFKTQLEAKGAVLVEKQMDKQLLRAVYPTYGVISNAEAVANHANLDGVRYGVSYDGESLDDIMIQTRSQGFGDSVKQRFIAGAYSLDDRNQEEVYNQAKRVRRMIVDAYASLFEDVDVMIALASSQIAAKIEGPFMDENTDLYNIVENHMVINNFSGYPSMTLPLGMVENMPIGLNLSSKPFTESTLFAYAKSFETLIDWKGSAQ